MSGLQSQKRDVIWLLGWVVLPYASYLGLVILAVAFATALRWRGKQIWQLCGQRGFGWLTAGLLLSSSAAVTNRGDAFLQLTNFLPFFLFFGVLALEPAVVKQPFAKLETIARTLLLTSTPLTSLAIVQYLLKTDVILDYATQRQVFPRWLMRQIYGGAIDRADVFFSNSNTLSAYLLMLFGLGLGLLIKRWIAPQGRTKSVASQAAGRFHQFEIVATLLCGGAIFSTGSRMGLAIALLLLAVALYQVRSHRWVLITGVLCGGALILAAATLSIGERTFSLAMVQSDVRGPLWELAVDLFRQRPWLGWGLGGLRSQYVSGSISGYEQLAHAHNIWLFLASETGIPVMVGFSVVIGKIYYDGVAAWMRQKYSPAHQAVLLGYLLAFTSCILYGLIDVVLFDSRVNVLSWSVLAAVYVLSRAPSKPVGFDERS
ncbi:MAG: O-antigen ligase family protein [Cyanobacteria bacterium J06554_11]